MGVLGGMVVYPGVRGAADGERRGLSMKGVSASLTETMMSRLEI